MSSIGTGEIVLLLLVALLLFGAKRLPEIGRSLGSGMREFKDSVSGVTKVDTTPELPVPVAHEKRRPSPSRLAKPNPSLPSGLMPSLPRRLGHGEEATLIEHLEELRQRLFVCLAALTIGFIVGYVVHAHLVHWLTLDLPANHRKLTTLSIGEPFMTSMWVSLWFGLLLATPVILWQAWSFFIPAVATTHARMLKGLVFVATILLACGVAFGYFVALPAASKFLTNYDRSIYHEQIQAKPFLTFATHVLLAMALVFELPIFVVGLTRTGILTTQKLRKNRRIGYFVVLCIGVALPGVDPVTTVIETIPLLVLYEASIQVSRLLDRRSDRNRAATEA